MKQINENKEKMSLEQGNLEKIFSDCVVNVTDAAIKRRSKQIQGKVQKFNITGADKRKILEDFITRPQIYSILCEKLFPDENAKTVNEIFESEQDFMK